MAEQINFKELPHRIVVWDPEDEHWEGGLVTEEVSRRLEARGVCTLPVVPDLFRMSGVGGYSRRGWGAGFPLDSRVPRMAAPLVLFCHPNVRGLHWRARLVPANQQALSSEGRDGYLRFAADSGQRMPVSGAYQEIAERPVMSKELGDPDRHGGWTVGGQGVVAASAEGHYGFALYGLMPGLRAVWVAATMAPIG